MAILREARLCRTGVLSGAVMLIAVVAALLWPVRTLAASTQSAVGTVLQQPTSVAYDAAGNLYFAESRNHVVRRVDTTGQLTTVAGSMVQGFAGDGGAATSAELDSPRGVALDAAGNLYIADTHNNRIRRVDAATQQISTLAGTGVAAFGGDGGVATSARLSAPLALALDGSNHLYVADTGNQRLRAIDLGTGVITTVAGNGQQGYSGDNGAALKASLDTPSGLVADGFGNLFFSDTGNHRVREVSSATQKVVTLASDGTSGVHLSRPEGLSLDPNGGLLISDAAMHCVYLFNLASGRMSVIAGNGTQAFEGDQGLATLAMLDSPTGVAAGPAGAVVIADTNNGRVRQVSAESNGTIATIAGAAGLLQGSLVLNGANSQSYGSAVVSARFSSFAPGSGPVSLVAVSNTGSQVLATGVLAEGAATFDLSALPAGTYQLQGVFSGDTTHAGAQSSMMALTVSPLSVGASLAVPQLIYGQGLTALSGSLSGVLPRDQANVGVIFSLPGVTFPLVPGSYPVEAALNGAAAGNYALTSASSSLTVSQAPVVISLSHGGSGFAIAVVSTTIGRPTGAVSLLTDAGNTLASVPVSATGQTVISDSTLTAGTYNVVAIYSGDADFLAARSAVASVTVGLSPAPPVTTDFTLASSGVAALTVEPGGTASYVFNVQTTGGLLAGPVVLGVTGAPSLSSATFTPSLVSPGTTAATVTLNVILPRASASLRDGQGGSRRGTGGSAFGGAPLAGAALLPFIVLPGLGRWRRRGWRRAGRRSRDWGAVGGLLCLLIGLGGCGDRVVTGVASTSTTEHYTMLVTATTTRSDGTTLQHSATVTLAVP